MKLLPFHKRNRNTNPGANVRATAAVFNATEPGRETFAQIMIKRDDDAKMFLQMSIAEFLDLTSQMEHLSLKFRTGTQAPTDPFANMPSGVAPVSELLSASQWALNCLTDEACVPNEDFVKDCVAALRVAIAKAEVSA